MRSQTSYVPTPDEVEAMKERIFRENVAAGRIRLEPAAKGRFRGEGLKRKRKGRVRGYRLRGSVRTGHVVRKGDSKN